MLAWAVVTRLWSPVRAGKSTDKAAGARKGVRCFPTPSLRWPPSTGIGQSRGRAKGAGIQAVVGRSRNLTGRLMAHWGFCGRLSLEEAWGQGDLCAPCCRLPQHSLVGW